MNSDPDTSLQAKKLSDELSTLAALQSTALQSAVFIAMSPAEERIYGARGKRIRELYSLIERNFRFRQRGSGSITAA